MQGVNGNHFQPVMYRSVFRDGSGLIYMYLSSLWFEIHAEHRCCPSRISKSRKSRSRRLRRRRLMLQHHGEQRVMSGRTVPSVKEIGDGKAPIIARGS